MPRLSTRRPRPIAAALAALLLGHLATGCVPTGDDGDGGRAVADAGRDSGHGRVDSSQDTGQGSGVWLSNAPAVDPPTLLAPDPGEEGYWAAARLTPPSYPFDVKLISYTVGDGAAGSVTCSGTLAHQLQLYVESSVAPPATPVPAFDIAIPATTPDQVGHMGRPVSQIIDPPVRLEQGEHLFVAVQLGGSHPEVLCLQVNDVAPYDGNRNHWSGAASPPFSWVQLDSLGLVGSLLLTAYGEVVD